jgi:hypothetical protein
LPNSLLRTAQVTAPFPKLKTRPLWVGQLKFFSETGTPDRRFQSLCHDLLLSHSGHRTGLPQTEQQGRLGHGFDLGAQMKLGRRLIRKDHKRSQLAETLKMESVSALIRKYSKWSQLSG